MNFAHFNINNLIHHKFSHSTGSDTFSEENVNVMLEEGFQYLEVVHTSSLHAWFIDNLCFI